MAILGIFLRVFLCGLALFPFFFFRFFVTIFSFLDFILFLLERNVMNTILDPVSVCLVKRNISVPIYFDVPF